MDGTFIYSLDYDKTNLTLLSSSVLLSSESLESKSGDREGVSLPSVVGEIESTILPVPES